jgi:hypothetical protein
MVDRTPVRIRGCEKVEAILGRRQPMDLAWLGDVHHHLDAIFNEWELMLESHVFRIEGLRTLPITTMRRCGSCYE